MPNKPADEWPLATCAKLYYETFPNGRFETELAWYLNNGIVFSNKDYAVLARECDKDDKETYQGYEKRCEAPNAWYVAFAAGNKKGLKKAVEALFERHQTIIFNRRDAFQEIRTDLITNIK